MATTTDPTYDRIVHLLACNRVLRWYMGYDQSALHPAAGGWRAEEHGLPFKHHQIMEFGAQMGVHGERVVAETGQCGIERWWELALDSEDWRIPPDIVCGEMGWTVPPAMTNADGFGASLELCFLAYVSWLREFWGNTTHRAMAERFATALVAREPWSGDQIAALLDAAARELGPGAVDAPV